MEILGRAWLLFSPMYSRVVMEIGKQSARQCLPVSRPWGKKARKGDLVLFGSSLLEMTSFEHFTHKGKLVGITL